MALVAMSHSPSLPASYLENYLSRAEHWLWGWKITVHVSERTALLFAKAAGCMQKPRPVQLFGEPV
jgi:hypothetical protein